MKKLKPRDKKLVAGIVSGKTQLEAYKDAGYSVTSNEVGRVNAHRAVNRPHIQQAIEDALELHGATPEWAVSQLMKVAAQDEEIGAKRLAAKDILELHGWNKNEKPTVQLQVKNAFFKSGRTIEGELVE
jgi:phage terminase small subunit